MIRREELPLIEWKQPVNGEEEVFTKALAHNPIVKSTVEELKQVLRLVMIKVGLREKNFPVDEEKVVIIDHILLNYGNHTPLEIKLAFDLAMVGKLNLEEKEVCCYENFSCLYFSKIMNAYRLWAKDTYSQLKKDEPKMIEEKKEVTPEDMIAWIKDWREKKDINVNLIPLSFYNFLADMKIIEVSDAEKWEYMEKASQSIKAELHEAISICKTTDALKEFAEFEKMEKEGFTGTLKTRIANKARKMIVFKYLKGSDA